MINYSYQVVIVAGVPQKCTPTSKDGREKNKGLEFIVSLHKTTILVSANIFTLKLTLAFVYNFSHIPIE